RTKPIVGRSEEFVRWVGAFGDVSDAVGSEDVMMHEIAGGFAGKRIAVIRRRQRVTVKKRNSASGREVAGVESGGSDVRAQGINTAGGTMVGDVVHLEAERRIGVPLEVFELHHHLLDVVAVRADELAAEFVEALAEL